MTCQLNTHEPSTFLQDKNKETFFYLNTFLGLGRANYLVIIPLLISYTISFFFRAVQLVAAERHKVGQFNCNQSIYCTEITKNSNCRTFFDKCNNVFIVTELDTYMIKPNYLQKYLVFIWTTLYESLYSSS